MKKFLLASVAALGLAGTASAADMAVKAPVVYAPVFTWTGCYLGINGGWIGSDESYETYRRGPFTDFDPDSSQGTPPTQTDVNLLRRSFSSDESGGTAGGQFGCQMQWGSVVLGGEWDWNWSGLEEDSSAVYATTPWVSSDNFWYPRTEHHHKQLDWFMTARTRLGWAAWDRFLVYVTGGVALGAYDAYTNVLVFEQDFGRVNGSYYGGYREKRLGYTVGGGFEWAFANNWTAKAEFLYLDFGSFDYISPRENYNADKDYTYAWHTHVEAQEYVVRVGLNYLFHTGGAPVVARY